MAKKKSFKLETTGNSTMEQLLNYNNDTEPTENKTILDIKEVDQETQAAIESKIEKHDRRVLLMMKPSVYEKISYYAWQHRMSVNAYINKALEEKAEKESEEAINE